MWLAVKQHWFHYDEAQGAVFGFCGIPMCLFIVTFLKLCMVWSIATMHAWKQLGAALVYVLIEIQLAALGKI